MSTLPVFKSDREAEKFLDRDLSDYLSADNPVVSVKLWKMVGPHISEFGS
jgi:hypothetical protein